MNGHPIVQLLSDYLLYQENHPTSSVDDYCRYRLLKSIDPPKKEIAGGLHPPSVTSLLVKILARIGKLTFIFSESALKDLGLKTFDEFGALSAIGIMQQPNKANVATAMLVEYSTAVEIINRLIKRGLATELADINDKRAKLLQLTPKGEVLLKKCYERMDKLTTMMLSELPELNKHICVALLQDTEIKLSNMFKENERFFLE
ncbi:MAG: winged helix DNA-binding protein [Chitinophagales bacterium]|nr:winged helix DNA-binding protein [Chitinophagales bacterium]